MKKQQFLKELDKFKNMPVDCEISFEALENGHFTHLEFVAVTTNNRDRTFITLAPVNTVK